MKPKSIKPNELDSVFSAIKKGDDESIGSYLIKGYRIQISKHNLTGAERVQMLYKIDEIMDSALFVVPRLLRKILELVASIDCVTTTVD